MKLIEGMKYYFWFGFRERSSSFRKCLWKGMACDLMRGERMGYF